MKNDLFEEFKKYIPENVDAVLITSEENRNYFTGFNSSDGFLIIAREKSVFLTDSRYIEAAKSAIKGCEVREFYSWKKQAEPLMKDLKINTLALEADKLTVSQYKKYRTLFNETALTTEGTDKAIGSMRSVKNEDEVEKIILAQRIAERAFAHILGFIKPGVTEKDISLELDFFMLRNGAEKLSFETIAITGANTSKPHGVPGDIKVKSGDFVTMDFGAVVSSYHSDMTRTVAVGEVSSKQAEVYNTVLAAQNAVFPTLKPGTKCADADKAARDVITNAGYGKMFRHSTGHGVGVEIHEKPVLSPNSNEILKAGNIVTNEPGIYIPGEFGVRIEDMALITENYHKNLTNAEKKLIVL